MFPGESQMTYLHPPRPIPAGCYDCADGFYDPVTRVITSYSGGFVRSAGETQNARCSHQGTVKEWSHSPKNWDRRACVTLDRNIQEHPGENGIFKIKLEMKYCRLLEKGEPQHVF